MRRAPRDAMLRRIEIRCLIVDDNRLFLEAAQTLLEREGIAVLGTARTGSECLRRVAELRPDLVLLDIDLGEESGFDLANRALSSACPVSVIFISTDEEPEYNDLAIKSGAAGFLPKSALSRKAIERLLDRVPSGQ
jgi:DNA-binding NarL/FixJ family response regulator